MWAFYDIFYISPPLMLLLLVTYRLVIAPVRLLACARAVKRGVAQRAKFELEFARFRSLAIPACTDHTRRI